MDFQQNLSLRSIAINGGKYQPAIFKVNEPMDLEDCNGMIMQVTAGSESL